MDPGQKGREACWRPVRDWTQRAARPPHRLLPASSLPSALGTGRKRGCPFTLHSIQALPQAVSGLGLSCSVRSSRKNPLPGGSSACWRVPPPPSRVGALLPPPSQP